LFRESLKEFKSPQKLFNEFNRQLDQAGLISRKGQLVDASFVKLSRQRNTPNENARIKAGEVSEGWAEIKLDQKDTDASVHDSKLLEDLLDDDNTSCSV